MSRIMLRNSALIASESAGCGGTAADAAAKGVDGEAAAGGATATGDTTAGAAGGDVETTVVAGPLN